MTGVEVLQQQQSRVSAPLQMRRKTSKFVALLLSFLTPGLGAAYNGQTTKALVHFALFAGCIQMATMTDATAFFILSGIGMWFFAAVDAYRTAQLICAGLAPQTESDAITRRLYGHPLAWSVVLIALGTIFLLHTIFGVHLLVRQLLPIALVVLGAYMLFDYLRSRRNREMPVFDQLNPPPSVIGSAPLDMTRFRTGDLVTQTAPRSSSSSSSKRESWPFEPRM